jgi:protocatechuate 3,4-dioxygenase beta subunit
MEQHDDHGGLARDLRAMLSRRELLGWMAGASLVWPLIGCGDDGAATIDAGVGPDGGQTGACSAIPEETAGPYPGDGSIDNISALTLSGIVRSDVRSSIAGVTGTAHGVPLTLKVTLQSVGGTCAALAGYAVYMWQCDREARYSMFTLPSQNYLRGVQETGSDGTATFQTIFPGCYAGRWPHIHFEIYPSLAKATTYGNKLNTSQLALPGDVCSEVYAQSGYEASVTNLAQISLATDSVFRDGASLQIATVTGSVGAGYVASLNVAI